MRSEYKIGQVVKIGCVLVMITDVVVLNGEQYRYRVKSEYDALNGMVYTQDELGSVNHHLDPEEVKRQQKIEFREKRLKEILEK